VKKTPKELKTTLSLLKEKKTIRASATSRMSTTLKYLKTIGIDVSWEIQHQTLDLLISSQISNKFWPNNLFKVSSPTPMDPPKHVARIPTQEVVFTLLIKAIIMFGAVE
jgi:hypothetical protein